MDNLADRISQLSPEQLAKLTQKLQQKQPQIPSIPVQSRDTNTFPLSFAQQRLWFLHQLQPESPFYNVPATIQVAGPLNVLVLERSLTALCDRHEPLRTVFALDATQAPVQVIQPPSPWVLDVIDLQGLSPKEQQQQIKQCEVAVATTPFNLAKGPLFTTRLLQLAPAEHILYICFHHIITDGWALQRFVHELSALYQAFQHDLPSPLAPLKIQYVDYAVWQRQHLQQNHSDRHLHYWQQQLEGVPTVLRLPTDYPRPAVQSLKGARYPLKLGPAMTQSLKRLSQDEGTTLFMTVLAAFNVLLYRYTEQTDLLVGTPVANRNQVATEELIGVLVNMLALRTQLQREDSFHQLLQRVKTSVVDANAHQDLPFEQLIDAMQVQRSRSYAPLLQVILTVQAAPMGRLICGDLVLQPDFLDTKTIQFDLALHLVETAEGLQGSLTYNTDLFSAETIHRMANHLQMILEKIISTPDCSIAQIPLLTPSESEKVLRQWPETQVCFPKTFIHKLFEQQVERCPHQPAVVFAKESLSYFELNTRANQLAHYLQAAGVGPETFVGIYIERSIDMVVGLLGILKAGGAYVPLDPNYSENRLGFILKDTNISILITQANLANTLPTANNIHTISIDTDWSVVASSSSENPPTSVSPRNLAYVIYTSGSTGQPKGVIVEHQQLMLYTQAITQRLQLEDCKSFATVSTFAADLGNTVIFPALTNGGCLHIIETERTVNPEALAEYFTYHVIDCLKIVPSHLAALLTTAQPERVLPQKRLILGGEACSRALIEQIQSYGTECLIFNHYGPTETTVGALTHALDTDSNVAKSDAEFLESPTVPLGRPLANTQIYLLDAELQPVPLGVPGEIYIGGAGVARGYLNRPDLTAQKFVANPFRPGRLYKTGDLGRYQANGNIEFLGRIDHQVKLRGFRIELGEIETMLSQHVKQCVVLVQADTSGNSQLVAYVVMAADQTNVTASDLKQTLKGELPEYMVPNVIMFLDVLPLTPNGKVDHRALPVPSAAELMADQTYVAPQSERQRLLVQQFAQVLSLPAEHIGLHADFFELGGHSLLATQLMSRLRQMFEVDVSLPILFEASTVAELDQVLQSLEKSGATQQTIPAIVPLSPTERDASKLPLSFAQQRLWFLNQLESNSAIYNIPKAVRIEGSLDVTAMQQALDALVARHESLRTCFPAWGDSAVQCVFPKFHLPLTVIEASDLDYSITNWLTEQAQLPFDLETGPLLRVKLLRLEPTQSILSVVLHHIVSDAWSAGIFIREITALYLGYQTGQRAELPHLPIQYADYGAWQRQWLQGDVLKQQVHYWQQQLAGAPALLDLPTDCPRPAVQSFQGSIHQVMLPRELTAAVKTLGQQQGVTLFMVLLAAFQLLLARYSAQRDIVVGSPIANRQHSEVEGLIGFFVNTLVLRTTIDSSATVADLLQQVRRVALEAYAHQDLPFEQVVEAVSSERTLAHSPLFQVMFILQNAPTASLELDDITLTPLEEMDTATAKFDLTLSMQETEQGLWGRWEYNSDLFKAETISRMATHFETLLGSMVADVQQSVVTLPMLTSHEQQQLLVDWNNTAIDYPYNDCIHQLFERQAAHTPKAVAALFGDESVSYETLNTRANQLAHALQHLGVGPETLVGLCVERSLDMLVGILGILKAGGAYVPLDPSYPRERLHFMLADSQVSLLVTQRAIGDKLPMHQAKQICLDTDWDVQIQPHDTQNPISGVNSNSLAYVMYTSGSTGKPKGVQGLHQGTVNRLRWMWKTYPFQGSERCCQKTAFSFVDSVWELFGGLLQGVPTLIIPNEIVKDPHRLIKTLSDNQISRIVLVPSLLKAILAADNELSDQLSYIKYWVTSGETLESGLWKQFRDILPNSFLINLYGSSEVSADVTCHEVWQPRHSDKKLNSNGLLSLKDKFVEPPCIGRPIANSCVYILDPHLQLTPVGVPGELHIGGAGVARGYLNQPELTAEKFIANPFGEGRLYKTGDWVCYRSDGTIEFLGRIDHQVKIRGFRVELGEIETVLSGHSGVQQCAVVVREISPDTQRLVAYVVGDDDLDSEDLKAYLKRYLLEYMIPSVFVSLQALPLTPNGKLARNALPGLEDNLIADAGLVVPNTPDQVALANLFAEVLVLPVEQIGIHSNFFELGGHSLLATQISARIRRIFYVEMPLRQLFVTPTVAGLTEWLAVQKSTAQETTLISQMSREHPIPLSFAQERIWFLEQFDPGNAAYNHSVAVHLLGGLHVDALQQSLQALVERHEILRTTFPLDQGRPAQRIAADMDMTLTLIDLQALMPDQRMEEVQRMAVELAHQPFDLTQGPLLRSHLLHLSDREYVLLWSMHHIISDGWSMGVLVRDLAALYTAATTATPPPLTPLSIQYADFAQWQRQWLTGDVLEHQLTYWRQKLGGKLPVLRLPMDYPPSASPSSQGAAVTLQLSTELTDKLQTLGQNVGNTLFMTLLAGFKALLYAYTGQHDMVVGTDIANRNRAEVEDLIGFFVNLLVLRTDLSGNPKFRDLLDQVREVSLEAYAHQDVPFAQLVQELQTNTVAEVQRRGDDTPLFQVLFVMQNAPFRPIDLSDLKLTPLELASNFAKFVLALFVHETPAGISITWNYSTDRFAEETIRRMAHQFETLLQQVTDQPDIPLEALAAAFAQRQSSQKTTQRRKKFKRVTPQAVQQSAIDVVTMQPLSCGVLTIQPKHKNVDIVSWAKEQREMIGQKLRQQGALLFRGFAISSAQDFEHAAEAICPDLFGEYGDLPRTGVSEKVYGSTPYPEDKAILFHNESSHLQQWPMKIWFCCLQPSQQGGETPIADCRQIYQSLSLKVRDRIKEKQLMYVRNYIKGLDVDWQDFFHTTERSVVEQRCKKAGVEWEWLANDGLQTRQVRPAVVRHPYTSEWVVFNQLQLHHLSHLDAPTQRSLLSLFGEDRLPRQVYYGDGTPIEPTVLDALQVAYKQAEKAFSWQKGDILMLDNMLMAHGRNSYVGPRKIAVAMGEIMTESKLKTLSHF